MVDIRYINTLFCMLSPECPESQKDPRCTISLRGVHKLVEHHRWEVLRFLLLYERFDESLGGSVSPATEVF
jgi:hypothetical protein